MRAAQVCQQVFLVVQHSTAVAEVRAVITLMVLVMRHRHEVAAEVAQAAEEVAELVMGLVLVQTDLAVVAAQPMLATVIQETDFMAEAVRVVLYARSIILAEAVRSLQYWL